MPTHDARHPDKQRNLTAKDEASDKMKQINVAYETLMDDEKRISYDKLYAKVWYEGPGRWFHVAVPRATSHLLQSRVAKTQKDRDSGEGQNTYFPATTYVFGTPIGI